LIALNLSRTFGFAVLKGETLSIGMSLTERAVPEVSFGIKMLANHGKDWILIQMGKSLRVKFING
jgi:hypothetical protein